MKRQISTLKFTSQLPAHYYKPLQLEREWTESLASLLGGRVVGNKWIQKSQPGSSCDAGHLLLCVSVSWSPTGILKDFETDPSGNREKQVSAQQCKLAFTVLSFSTINTCLTLVRTISRLLLIGEKMFLRPFVLDIGKEGSFYLQSCLSVLSHSTTQHKYY